MRTRKLVVGVMLVTLLGSDLGLGVLPALAQTPGSGPMPVPSLTDGALGAPAPGTPYQPQQPFPSQQPTAPRPIAPGPVAAPPTNLCQPSVARPYQVVTVPSNRVPQPVPQTPPTLPGGTQVAAAQGALAAPGPGVEPGRLVPVQVQPAGVPEGEGLSRIEATFNIDPVRQLAVPMGTEAGLGPYGVPLRQYGYTMFASNVSTFAPVDDIPVGPDYVLGPGDGLTINVWGAVDSTLVRTVDRSGQILLPKVGDLRVWGLTFSQADRLIREQLARYFRGFQTSVTMGRLRTVTVHVVGEVCQPGVYTLSSLTTVTNALFSAGGPSKLGTLRDVRLIRGSSQVAKLDMYDFLQRGDRTRDFRLESGDTIFVPTIGDVVAVAGEVKRPAIYEIRSTTRLADVVELAGGVTPTSYLKRVQIVRATPSAERVTLDVDLTGYYLKGDEKANPPVNAGDLVLIHRSDPRVYNTVKVDGAVKYPGAYELKPMMRISQLLPAERLLPEAYPDRIEVARRRPDLSMEIIPVDLRKAWTGDKEQDLLLKPLDEVTVRTELKPAKSVTLTGQGVRPGVYTITDGEHLSSVLARAGGLTERANLKAALFTRASLRKVEQEQLDLFMKSQEQRMLSAASTVVVGADKDEQAARQAALEARRQLLQALSKKVILGRMVIHLDQPDKLKATENDVVLLDGDTLDVPEPAQSILVLGAVRNSTSVQFKESAGVDYYVNRAGGFSKEADKGEVYIAKADGSAMASFTNVRTVEPGDSIIVPPKSEEKTRWLPTFSAVAQIFGSTLLGLAALVALGL